MPSTPTATCSSPRAGDFGGSLLAQPLDLKSLETKGEPVVVAEQIGLYGDFLGFGDFTVSNAGTLVFDASQLATRFEWFDRGGKQVGVFGTPAPRFGMRISPDGSRIAFGQEDAGTQTSQVWIGDVARGIQTRLTSGPGSNSGPLWSPDGLRVAYQTDRKHQADVYIRSAGGAGPEETLTDEDGQRIPNDWSPDGKYIIVSDREAAGGRLMQLGVLPVGDPKKPFTFLPRAANDFGGVRFSPDGKWVVYEQDESGRREIYAVSFPDAQRKVQISSNGGLNPKWIRNGKEIIYTGFDGKVMSVDVEPGQDLRVGATRALFQLPESAFGLDVTADGERFLVNVPVIKSSSVPLSVVVNWTAGLKK